MDAKLHAIRRFFQILEEQLPSYQGSDKLFLFSVSVHKWSIQTSTNQIRECSSSDVTEPDASLTTDVNTLFKLCIGKIKTMTAVLNGNLKVTGEKKAFALFGDVLKAAIAIFKESEVGHLKALTERASFQEANNRSPGKHLSASIVGSEMGRKDKKTFTYYIIHVVDNELRISWDVRRRYSEFEQLHRHLQLWGLTSLPPFPPKYHLSRYSSTNVHLVKERIASLGRFITSVLSEVDSQRVNPLPTAFSNNADSTALVSTRQSRAMSVTSQRNVVKAYGLAISKFLNLNTHHQKHNNFERESTTPRLSITSLRPSELGDDTDSVYRESTMSTNMTRSLTSNASGKFVTFESGGTPNLPPLLEDDWEEVEDTYETALLVARKHANEPIKWLGGNRTTLIDVIHRTNLRKRSGSPSSATNLAGTPSSKFILTFTHIIVQLVYWVLPLFTILIMLCVVCGGHVSSPNFSTVHLTSLDVHVSSLSPLISKDWISDIEASMPIQIKVCVHRMLLYGISHVLLSKWYLCVLVINTFLTIPHTKVACMCTVLGWLGWCSYMRYPEQGSSETWVEDVEVMGMFVMQLSVQWVQHIVILTLHSPLLMYLCCFTFPQRMYNRLLSKIRTIRLFSIAFLLAVVYVAVQVYTVRMDSARKDATYSYVDTRMAPYIVHQIGELKSIFVKFAQYMGGRSDMISPVWCRALGCLHDQCPPSNSAHILNTLKEELHIKNTNDVFDYFELDVPIAAASIAQVHRGMVKDPITGELTIVAVKIQHENIASIMKHDIQHSITIAKWAMKLNMKWELLVTALEGWSKTIETELDFKVESEFLLETGMNMQKSGIHVAVPRIFPHLTTAKVLVMSFIEGFKVNDMEALDALKVDRSALMNRVAHCVARQLLVDGVLNADPHPGNILFGPYKSTAGSGSSSNIAALCAPGLLDFGMCVRVSLENRMLYCRLIIALFEGDTTAAMAVLSGLGYETNQSNRAPERDVEFFQHLFRDYETVGRDNSTEDTPSSLSAQRQSQKLEDIQSNIREKGGRYITTIPEDFMFLSRVIGLLRGLNNDLNCSCPILHVLALHARVGLLSTQSTGNSADGNIVP